METSPRSQSKAGGQLMINESKKRDLGGNSGGLGFWWRDVEVNIVSYSSHHCAVDIINDDRVVVWRAIGIYGWPDSTNKYRTWSLMTTLKADCTSPCLMFGDFNEIISLREKEGGAIRSESQMNAFGNAIDRCFLKDLGFKGGMFTWQRGNNPNTFIRERLDRFLGDNEWCFLFPNYEVTNLPIYKSDHAPIVLNTEACKEKNKQGKLFKFEALWLSRDDCWNVVNDAWKEFMSMDTPAKIVNCANKLTEWVAATFGNIKRRIKEAEKELRFFQDERPDQHMLSKCKELADELDELHRLEEFYWHSRGKGK
ncbi:Flagellar hook-associated protein 1 [Bienertia sinuspersici]